MNKIPSKSCKILKLLDKQSSFNIEPYNFGYIRILIDEGLVKQHKSLTLENLKKNAKSSDYLTITTNGVIYLATNKIDNMRIYIPVIVSSVLSVIAIIISIFALLKP